MPFPAREGLKFLMGILKTMFSSVRELMSTELFFNFENFEKSNEIRLNNSNEIRLKKKLRLFVDKIHYFFSPAPHTENIHSNNYNNLTRAEGAGEKKISTKLNHCRLLNKLSLYFDYF